MYLVYDIGDGFEIRNTKYVLRERYKFFKDNLMRFTIFKNGYPIINPNHIPLGHMMEIYDDQFEFIWQHQGLDGWITLDYRPKEGILLNYPNTFRQAAILL